MQQQSACLHAAQGYRAVLNGGQRLLGWKHARQPLHLASSCATHRACPTSHPPPRVPRRSGDGTARIWDPVPVRGQAPRAATVLLHDTRPDKARDVTTIDWNPDSSLLATGSYDGMARVWTREGGWPGGGGDSGQGKKGRAEERRGEERRRGCGVRVASGAGWLAVHGGGSHECTRAARAELKAPGAGGGCTAAGHQAHGALSPHQQHCMQASSQEAPSKPTGLVCQPLEGCSQASHWSATPLARAQAS